MSEELTIENDQEDLIDYHEETVKPVVSSSIPAFDKFSPTIIPFQQRALYHITKKYNYDDLPDGNDHLQQGCQTVVLSGAVGSSKTLFEAHLIWRHALKYPGAFIGIGRRDLKRLRETLLEVILKHAPTGWEPGEEFEYNITQGKITLPNKSVIQCYSWSDLQHLDKFRSLEFSMFVIEEAAENNQMDVYDAILERIGRLSHVKEKLFVLACNPSNPEHWIKTKLIDMAAYVDGKLQPGDADVKNPNIHVFYSLTKDNPFLPKSYIRTLKRQYNELQIQRYLEGKWVSFSGDGIYFAYDTTKNFIAADYVVDPTLPIYLSFDFNCSKGKPFSTCLMQFKGGTFHIFDECVVENSNTHRHMEYMHDKGWFKYPNKIIICGDATGRAKQSSSNGFSNYDIIVQYLNQYKHAKVKFDMMVPESNPAISARHNVVNAYCKNGLGEHRLFIYKKCPVSNEGLKLSKMQKDGKKEDDSFSYQHISTSIGYAVSILAANVNNKSYIINR